MTLVIGGEDDRAVDRVQVLEAFDTKPGEDTSQRQNPGRKVDSSHDSGRQRSVPRGEVNRLDNRSVSRRRLFDERPQLRNIARRRERSFVDVRLKCVLERNHQLDTFERAQAKLLDRRLCGQILAARVFRKKLRHAVGRNAGSTGQPTGSQPLANRRALQFPCAFGSR